MNEISTSSVGFPWAKLSKESVVVDVGGGLGHQMLTLARNFSDLRFVVQDREPVIQDAVAVGRAINGVQTIR